MSRSLLLAVPAVVVNAKLGRSAAFACTMRASAPKSACSAAIRSGLRWTSSDGRPAGTCGGRLGSSAPGAPVPRGILAGQHLDLAHEQVACPLALPSPLRLRLPMLHQRARQLALAVSLDGCEPRLGHLAAQGEADGEAIGLTGSDTSVSHSLSL